MTKAIFLPVVLLISTICFSEDPIKFRGSYIGQRLSDFVDCSSPGKAKPLRTGYKTHGALCEGKSGILMHEHLKGLLNPKMEGERLFFENHALVKMVIFIPNNDWGKTRYDISQKMGEPSSEVPQVYQNGFGAKWEYDQGFWVSGDTVVYAGIKVLPVRDPLGRGMATEGFRVTVIGADRAKLPDRTPSTMD